VTAFTRFAAIDWSGAKGDRHKGIAIAACGPGQEAPELIAPGRIWSREAVLRWIRERSESGDRWLIGMDFSFAPPLIGRGCYLPGENVPDHARAFWAYVDAACDDGDLGAASFLEQRHRRHFYFGAADGRKADFMHFRQCELAFNARGGGKPSTVYDAIGAAQVAKASFAGMRLLYHLGDALPIWPFDPVLGEHSTIVEIYCRAFIRMGGARGLKLRTMRDLNTVLAGLGSAPVVDAPYSDHETDVLAAAAGLRRIAADNRYWRPQGLTPETARTEGWTFGVD
jgi:hypothetical protein